MSEKWWRCDEIIVFFCERKYDRCDELNSENWIGGV
jgi:hypothetical protein